METKRAPPLVGALPISASSCLISSPLLDKHEDVMIDGSTNIGNGPYGAIFKGTYKHRPCAAKLLTHHAFQLATQGAKAGIQSQVLQGIHEKCFILKSLQHDNIVGFYTSTEERKSKLPMLITELMDSSLKDYLEEKLEKPSLSCQVSLCLDVSKGLEYLHSQKLIHRGICDRNILISSTTGRAFPIAKIADSGMSMILPPAEYISESTATSRRVYLPPEASEDGHNYALDMYSFGVIVVQIVSTKTEIKKKSELNLIVEKVPESHLLKHIIHSCLSENCSDRPQAADTVRIMTSALLQSHNDA